MFIRRRGNEIIYTVKFLGISCFVSYHETEQCKTNRVELLEEGIDSHTLFTNLKNKDMTHTLPVPFNNNMTFKP